MKSWTRITAQMARITYQTEKDSFLFMAQFSSSYLLEFARTAQGTRQRPLPICSIIIQRLKPGGRRRRSDKRAARLIENQDTDAGGSNTIDMLPLRQRRRLG